MTSLQLFFNHNRKELRAHQKGDMNYIYINILRYITNLLKVMLILNIQYLVLSLNIVYIYNIIINYTYFSVFDLIQKALFSKCNTFIFILRGNHISKST